MEEEQKQPQSTGPKEGLGDRMKKYEAKFMQKIDPKLPFIIRLDGHKFSGYSKIHYLTGKIYWVF